MKYRGHVLGVFALSLLVTDAKADFIGLSSEVVNTNLLLDGRNLGTIRVYANFDDPADVAYVMSPILVEFESPIGVVDLLHLLEFSTSDPLGFYQHDLGADTSAGIDSALFAVHPNLEWDSWLTIGAENSTNNVVEEIEMEWEDFNSGGGISELLGAVFTDPLAPQAIPVAGRLLLAQFTVGMGETVQGNINMQGVLGQGNFFIEWVANNFIFEVCETPASDLSFGTRSGEGLFPKFGACGNFGPGNQGQLKLRRAPSFSLAYLFFSTEANPVPVLGGFFAPQFPVLPFYVRKFSNALGEITIPVNGISGPVDLTAQWMIVDPGNEFGVTLSNALELHLGV